MNTLAGMYNWVPVVHVREGDKWERADPPLRDWLIHALWMDLPAPIKPLYKQTTPIKRTIKPVRILWGPFELIINVGFFTDMSSFPLSLGLFGISRFTAAGIWDLAGTCHDGPYRGVAKFTKDHRLNRELADALWLALAKWGGANSASAHLKWRLLRMFGWLHYKPTNQHSGDIYTIKISEYASHPESIEQGSSSPSML